MNNTELTMIIRTKSSVLVIYRYKQTKNKA